MLIKELVIDKDVVVVYSVSQKLDDLKEGDKVSFSRVLI